MIDPAALHMVLSVLTGWLDRREREVVAYLIEENRLLRRQLGIRRPRLTDDDRRRLAAQAYHVGRAALREIATPDTLRGPVNHSADPDTAGLPQTCRCVVFGKELFRDSSVYPTR